MQFDLNLSFDCLNLALQVGDDEGLEMCQYLFTDVISSNTGQDREALGFKIDESGGVYNLQKQDGSINFQFKDCWSLGIHLLNGVITSLAYENPASVSLHAALVSNESGSVLMPGRPNSGKTIFCCGLTALGMNYHTDEFISINRETLDVKAFTRPFTFRKSGYEVIKALLESIGLKQWNSKQSDNTAWIAHREINPSFKEEIPEITAIVFPTYTTDSRNEIIPVSKARAGMEMMKSHFQSQTFADHGFSTISQLVKNTPVYLLVYNDFIKGQECFNSIFS